MDIIPFDPRHLARLDPPSLSGGEAAILSARALPLGPAFTGIEDGRVLGCAGVIVRGRTGHAWASLSDEIRRRPVLLHRAVARGLETIIAEAGLEQVEATCHVKFQRAQRWLERLGFRRVGVCPFYLGTTETYYRYVR